jgi:hypothetical protein
VRGSGPHPHPEIAPWRRFGRRLALGTHKDLRELAEAQKRTDESLHALIDSLRGGGNGHNKRRVD